MRQEEVERILFEILPNAKKQRADTKPPPIKIQVPLIDTFERLKRVKADAWQTDFCNRLQEATINRHIKGVRALVHAMPQSGKSIILAQTLPVWLLGNDPLHRFALATYNIKRSQRHANTAIRMMQSAEYKDLFPRTESHLPNIVSPDNFFTNARRELNDGQASFNPMGLQSGFVGVSAETLSIDDPYRSAEEAMSETIRENIEVFWDETANVRLTEYANVFGMFHRYHQADLAGYLLATGEFDYWRYAAEADGDYTDDETGLVYHDPLNREVGEFISPRFSTDYYDRQKRNPKTWYSQFQGKPTGEEGTTFNIKKIHFIDPVTAVEQLEQLRRECVHWARAWDNAATKKETSAYTVGARMGITLDGRVLIDDIVRERLNTSERYDRQLETAEDDGFLIPVLIPNDPGSAGTDTAFQTVKMLEDEKYTCIADIVTGSKEARAQPMSLAVNSGKFYVALGEEKLKEFKKEFKNFPLSSYKDQVDASADAYRFIYKLLKSGTVIKNYSEARNLVHWDSFTKHFALDARKFPRHWKMYLSARISEDAKYPSGAVVMFHAAENSGFKDTLFISDEFKHSSGDYYKLFDWLIDRMMFYAPKQKPYILLRTESESIATTARAKLKLPVTIFDGDPTKGIAEMNWFYLERKEDSPFNGGEKATGIYYLHSDTQPLISARQESLLWKFNERGEPQGHGGIVMDAARMILADFKTRAEGLTVYEKAERHIEQNLPHLSQQSIDSEPIRQLQQQKLSRRVSLINKMADDAIRPQRNDDTDLYKFLELQGIL